MAEKESRPGAPGGGRWKTRDSDSSSHSTTKSPINDNENYDALLDGNIRAGNRGGAAAQDAAEAALLTLGPHDEGNAHCVYLRHAGRFAHNEAFGWLAYSGTHWLREGARRGWIGRLSTRWRPGSQRRSSSGQADKHADLIKKSIPNNSPIAYRGKGSATEQGLRGLLRL